MQITIDLTPYQVVAEGDNLVIKDCSGSVLSNLEKDSRLGWNECYGGWVGDKFVSISYENGECAFGTTDLTAVAEWIDANFDRIESIGYEALEDID